MRHARGDFTKYLRGRGIDIGAGDDCLVVPEGEVLPFDREHGDAQLLRGIADQTFDFVYSSHCLEHLRDVKTALSNWLRVLKHAGALYVVVPDYEYYEKLRWPSRFNGDHKQTFSIQLTRDHVKRDNHFNVRLDLAPMLDRLGASIVECHLELDRFDFNRGPEDQTLGDALSQICFVARRFS